VYLKVLLLYWILQQLKEKSILFSFLFFF